MIIDHKRVWYVIDKTDSEHLITIDFQHLVPNISTFFAAEFPRPLIVQRNQLPGRR